MTSTSNYTKNATSRQTHRGPFDGADESLREKRRALQAEKKRVQRKQGSGETLTDEDKRTLNLDDDQEVATLTLELLQGAGEFIRDEKTGSSYYFWRSEARLIYLGDNNSELTSLLNLHFGLNSADRLYRFVVQYLRDWVHKNGRLIPLHRFAFYDESAGKLFIDSNDGGMLILDDRVDEAANGQQGVFFLSEAGANRVQPDHAGTCDCDILDRLIFDIPNIAPGRLTESESRLLLKVCFYALFFPNLQPTKMMLLLVGPKDSGKSTFMRAVGKLLRGPRFQVGDVPKSKHDAQVVANNEPFVFWDNADSDVPWLPDFLATGATGTAPEHRQLYKDTDKVGLSVNAFFWLASRTPHFRRDDVFDRTVPILVESRELKTTEKSMHDDIERQRDHLWGHVIGDLLAIVRELKKRDASQATELRMADFYYVGGRIARALGRGHEWDGIVSKLRREQTALLYREEPIIDILQEWLGEPNNQGRVVTAKELHSALVSLDPSVQRDCPSPIALGKKLRVVQEAIEARGIDMTVTKDTHSKSNEYEFRVS